MGFAWENSSAGHQPLVTRFLRYTAAVKRVSDVLQWRWRVVSLLDNRTPPSCSLSSTFSRASVKPGCSSACHSQRVTGIVGRCMLPTCFRSSSACWRMAAFGSSVFFTRSRSAATSISARGSGCGPGGGNVQSKGISTVGAVRVAGRQARWGGLLDACRRAQVVEQRCSLNGPRAGLLFRRVWPPSACAHTEMRARKVGGVVSFACAMKQKQV